MPFCRQHASCQRNSSLGRFAYIHSQLVRKVEVYQDRRATARTELVVQLLLPESIVLQRIVAGMPDHLVRRGVDVEVAVLSAYRAIAAGH